MSVNVYQNGRFHSLAEAKVYHNGSWKTLPKTAKVYLNDSWHYLGNVSSGAIASGVVAINVNSGWAYVDAAVSGCSMTVRSGGSAENTTVFAGTMCVSSGGTAILTDVKPAGKVIVLAGGVAVSTTVSTGQYETGTLSVSSGGTAVFADSVDVCYGGYADYVSGCVYVSSGGTANHVSAGDLTVDHGGIVSNAKVNAAGGRMTLNGKAVSTTLIGAYDAFYLTPVMYINSGGIASGLSAYGAKFNLFIESGGSADTVNVNAGSSATIYNRSGGRATNLNLQYCYFVVSSGASVGNITVGNRAEFYVLNGGTATNVTVASGGTLGYQDAAVIDNVVSSAGAVITRTVTIR